MVCPDVSVVQSIIEGRGAPADREAVMTHAETCEVCRSVLAALVRTDELRPGEPGSRIGSFVVGDPLGKGAMGVVVAAHDPDLDREVAIKLLRPDGASGASPAEAQARLVREAQAMAKLSHPNVITVHQVGTVGTTVFVVMERIDGGTLRAWLAERRPWRAIRDVFVLLAGRGLSAAHAAGLVHRDFKPENVLVGSDGRVRVTDFGLVGVSGSSGGGTPEGDAQLTRSGSVLGTPRYMSPEQHRGRPVDARADQFAFCVALYEALFRRMPFDGTSLEVIGEEVSAGRVREPPRTDAPAWLRRAVLRGLRVRPEERYPSMNALLADLDPRPGARRAWIAAAAVAAMAAGAAWIASRPHAPICEGGAAQLAGVWDAAVKAKVEAQFAASGKPWGAGASERVADKLDARAAEWTAMHREACLATVRGEQSATALDLRMSCLRQRRSELAALSQLLAGGDTQILAEAPRAAATLPGLEECADVERLSAPVPLPRDPAIREAVARIRDVMSVARAEWKLGRYRESVLVAAPAAVAAQALGYRPLEAEALGLLGWLLLSVEQPQLAEIELRKAVLAADAGRDDGARLYAQIRLVEAAGKEQGRLDEGLRLAEAAQATLERRGAGGATDRATLAQITAGLLQNQGKWVEARSRYAEALALRERALGPDSPDVAMVLNALGGLAGQEAKWDEAIGFRERALAIVEKVYGPEHPRVAMVLGNLSGDWQEKGDLDRTQSMLGRALAIEEAALGPDNLQVARTLTRVAYLHDERGEIEKARELSRRVLAIYARTPTKPEHLATAIEFSGQLEYKLGNTAAGLAAARKGLAIREQALGPKSFYIGMSLGNIGIYLVDLGKYAEALEAFDRAYAINVAALRPNHPRIAGSLVNAAKPLAHLGRFAEARERVARALAILDKAGQTEHPHAVEARTALAEVYRREGHFEEALAEAKRADAIQERLAPDSVERSAPLAAIGQAQLALHRREDAVATLTRVLALLRRAGLRSPDIAEVQFALARAIGTTNRDRARALALEARGLDTLERKQIDAWLARHR